LGIVAEVIILCIIIFIYEKKKSKEMEDEVDSPVSDEYVCFLLTVSAFPLLAGTVLVVIV
jgi:hypothetical protein